MKTIFWSLNRQTVFLQNLLNHIRLLFSSIFDTSYNFFSTECCLCMFAKFLPDFFKQKVCFAQILAFSKVAKTEGEVFVALWASQGDSESSRMTISPQSPCSLTPDSIPVVCCLSFVVIVVHTFKNTFSSETTGLIEVRLFMEHLYLTGTIFYILVTVLVTDNRHALIW